MSRNVELLEKFAQEAGLYIYMQRSRLSEAEYVEVTTEDDDRRAKIRIANHETRPTYGRAYGYADFEIPKNGVSRGDVHGDVYHCIRWLAERFEKPVPAWAMESEVSKRSEAARSAAATRGAIKDAVEATLLKDLLTGDRTKRLTQNQVSELTRKYLPKAVLSRITSAFNDRRKATHISLRHDPKTAGERPSGSPRKFWADDVVAKPWLVEVQGKGMNQRVLERNAWRRASLPEAFAAAEAMADEFVVPIRPEDPTLLDDVELADRNEPKQTFFAVSDQSEAIIDPAHYDDRRHTVICDIGQDFLTKWQAYREDGFSVALQPMADDGKVSFQVFKSLDGSVPPLASPDQAADLLPTPEGDPVEQEHRVPDTRETGNIEMTVSAKLAFAVSDTDEKASTGDDEVRKRLWRTAKYAKDGGIYNGKPVWAGVADENGSILAVVSHQEAAQQDFLPEKYLPRSAYEAAKVPATGIFFHYNLSGHLDLTSHKPVSRDARIALEQSLDGSMVLNHWPQDQGRLAFAAGQPGTGWRKVTVEAARFEGVTPPGPVAAYQKGDILIHRPLLVQSDNEIGTANTGAPIGYEGPGVTRAELAPFLSDEDPGIAAIAATADRRLSLNASFKAVVHAVFQAGEPEGVKSMTALIEKMGGQVKRDGMVTQPGVATQPGARGWVASQIDTDSGIARVTEERFARLKDAKRAFDLENAQPHTKSPGNGPDTLGTEVVGERKSAAGLSPAGLSPVIAAMPYRIVPVVPQMFSNTDNSFELRARHWRSGLLGRDLGRNQENNPVWGGVVDLNGTLLTTVSKKAAVEADFDPPGFVDQEELTRLQEGSAVLFRFEDSGDLSLFSTKPATLVPDRIASSIREALDPAFKLESFERLLATLHDDIATQLAQLRNQGTDPAFLSRTYDSPASQALAFAIEKDSEAGESTRSPVVPPRKRAGDIWFDGNRECYLVDKALVVARRTDPAAVRRRREIAEDQAFEELARKLMPNAVIEIVDGVFPTADGAGVETCSGAALPPENDAAPKRIRVYLLATDTERLYKTLIHEAFHYHQLAGTLPREEYQHVIERSVEEAWTERLLAEGTTLEAVTGGWCRTRPVVPPSAILPGTAAWVYGSEGAAEAFAQHHYKALAPDYQSGFDLPVLSEQAKALFEGIASGEFGAARDAFFAANEPAAKLIRYSDGYAQSNDTVKKFSFAIDQAPPEAAPEAAPEAVAEGPAAESTPADGSGIDERPLDERPLDERPWPGNDPSGPSYSKGPLESQEADDPTEESNALMEFMLTKMGLNPAVAVAMDKVFLERQYTQEQEDWIAAPLVVHSQIPGGPPLRNLIPDWLAAQAKKERLDIVREEIRTGVKSHHVGPSEIVAIMMPATQSYPLDHAAADLYVWATLHAVAKRDDLTPEEMARRQHMELPPTSQMLRGHTMDGTAGGLYLNLSEQARRRAVETYRTLRRQERAGTRTPAEDGASAEDKPAPVPAPVSAPVSAGKPDADDVHVDLFNFSFAIDPSLSLAEAEPLRAPFEARVRAKALEILEANEEIGAARASDLTSDELTIVAQAELRDLAANYEEGRPPKAGTIRLALGEKALRRVSDLEALAGYNQPVPNEGHPALLHGYDENGAGRKTRFHSLARAKLKAVAGAMGLRVGTKAECRKANGKAPEGVCFITTNEAGPAASGDTHMVGPDFRVSVSGEPALYRFGRDATPVLYRYERPHYKPGRDRSGPNQWTSYAALDDPKAFAGTVRKVQDELAQFDQILDKKDKSAADHKNRDTWLKAIEGLQQTLDTVPLPASWRDRDPAADVSTEALTAVYAAQDVVREALKTTAKGIQEHRFTVPGGDSEAVAEVIRLADDRYFARWKSVKAGHRDIANKLRSAPYWPKTDICTTDAAAMMDIAHRIDAHLGNLSEDSVVGPEAANLRRVLQTAFPMPPAERVSADRMKGDLQNSLFSFAVDESAWDPGVHADLLIEAAKAFGFQSVERVDGWPGNRLHDLQPGHAIVWIDDTKGRFFLNDGYLNPEKAEATLSAVFDDDAHTKFTVSVLPGPDRLTLGNLGGLPGTPPMILAYSYPSAGHEGTPHCHYLPFQALSHPKALRDAVLGNQDYREPVDQHSHSLFSFAIDDGLMDRSQEKQKAGTVDAADVALRLMDEGRGPTPEEREILAGFTGWGAHPAEFSNYYSKQRLVERLGDDAAASAEQSTATSHYTDPRIAKALWSALEKAGFEGGKILEPGMGAGFFIGTMADDVRAKSAIVGVERDVTAAAVAKALYPEATVIENDLVKTALPDGSFDLAVGNVPFAKTAPYDPRYKNAKPTLHNYFILRSLDAVRPGGVVAVLTSRYTLDKKDISSRLEMHRRAELIDAVRLPTGAFAGANSDVVSDVLIFKKRDKILPQTESLDGVEPWVFTDLIDDPQGGEPLRVNAWFAQNPKKVIGEIGRTGTMYGSNRELGVRVEGVKRSDIPAYTAKHLAEKLDLGKGLFVEEQHSAKPNTAAADRMEVQSGAKVDFGYARPLGYVVTSKGEIRIRPPEYSGGGEQLKRPELIAPYLPLKEREAAVIRQVLPIRDTLRDVLRAQADGDPAQETHRVSLNRLYDAFRAQHGPICQFRRILEQDPDGPLLMALENRQPGEQGLDAWKKAAVFERDTSGPRPSTGEPSSVSDALALMLDERGYLDSKRMSQMLGLSEEEIISQAKGAIFKCPDGTLVTADEYLSGDVKTKLAEAEIAVRIDPSLDVNVRALRRVQPKDIPWQDMSIPFGSSIVEPSDVQVFLAELLNVEPKSLIVLYDRGTAKWSIEPADSQTKKIAKGVRATSSWGTSERPLLQLAEAVLAGRGLTIQRDGEIDYPATIEAQNAADRLKDEWKQFVFKDPERRERLAAAFNDTFNRTQMRQFDGSHLTFPDMSAEWRNRMRPQQKAAVWRGLTEGNTLFNHEAGVGKTAELIATAMEKRRMGLARKPMIAVQKSTLPDFTRTFQEMYPNANLLVWPNRDMTATERKAFFARAATGDWDCILVHHDAFDLTTVTPERERRFLQTQKNELRASVLRAAEEGGDKTRLVKQLSVAADRLESKIQALTKREKRDDAVFFDELGIDALLIDEAHRYKNLMVASSMERVKGLPSQNAQRAAGFWMKVQYLNEKYDEKALTLGTGTPVTNSLVEVFNLQRYLQPTALERAGVAHFDAWARTFAETEQRMEIGVAGNISQSTRLSRFVNLPELYAMTTKVFDNVSADTVPDLVRPNRHDGIVLVPATLRQRMFQEDLGKRAKALGTVDPKEDNMLKIATEGRLAALDMQLVDPEAEEGDAQKLSMLVDNITRIAADNPGSVQTVYFDVGINPTTYNSDFGFRASLIDNLVEAGFKRAEIADFAGVKKPEERAALQAAMREGKCRVGIGSTEVLGTGNNVQDKLVAMHHVDAPWRPSDIEQRDRRGQRQGNRYKDVASYRYVTEGSFDAFSWQLLDAKGRFIEQFFAGSTGRTMVNRDLEEISAAEVMAIASGDPSLMRRAALEAEIATLEILDRRTRSHAYERELSLVHMERRVASIKQNAAAVQADADTARTLYNGENRPLLTIELPDHVADDRGVNGRSADRNDETGELLITALQSMRRFPVEPVKIGTYGDFDVLVSGNGFSKHPSVDLRGPNGIRMPLEIPQDVSPRIMGTRLRSGLYAFLSRPLRDERQMKSDLEEIKALKSVDNPSETIRAKLTAVRTELARMNAVSQLPEPKLERVDQLMADVAGMSRSVAERELDRLIGEATVLRQRAEVLQKEDPNKSVLTRAQNESEMEAAAFATALRRTHIQEGVRRDATLPHPVDVNGIRVMTRRPVGFMSDPAEAVQRAKREGAPDLRYTLKLTPEEIALLPTLQLVRVAIVFPEARCTAMRAEIDARGKEALSALGYPSAKDSLWRSLSTGEEFTLEDLQNPAATREGRALYGAVTRQRLDMTRDQRAEAREVTISDIVTKFVPARGPNAIRSAWLANQLAAVTPKRDLGAFARQKLEPGFAGKTSTAQDVIREAYKIDPKLLDRALTEEVKAWLGEKGFQSVVGTRAQRPAAWPDQEDILVEKYAKQEVETIPATGSDLNEEGGPQLPAWLISGDEYVDRYPPEKEAFSRRVHERAVVLALKSGLPVPPDLAAAYPQRLSFAVDERMAALPTYTLNSADDLKDGYPSLGQMLLDEMRNNGEDWDWHIAASVIEKEWDERRSELIGQMDAHEYGRSFSDFLMELTLSIRSVSHFDKTCLNYFLDLIEFVFRTDQAALKRDGKLTDRGNDNVFTSGNKSQNRPYS